MRLAIFSDVHGNADALSGVLEDIKEQGTFDNIIFAGDLVYGLHQPSLCIDLIHEHDVLCVYGNTDEFLWIDQVQDDETSDEDWADFLEYLNWLQIEIGQEGLNFLKSFPFEQTIKPTADISQALLVVHANPKNVQIPIFMSEAEQMKRINKVLQPDTALNHLLDGIDAHTIAFGHLHVPNIRIYNQYTLANISSVSKPQDNDWRAKYAITEFRDNKWHFTYHQVSYDVAKTKQKLLASGMPNAEVQAEAMKL
ncbi:MAG: metallophosphoesterase family protein [Chloroflexota bacterium]